MCCLGDYIYGISTQLDVVLVELMCKSFFYSDKGTLSLTSPTPWPQLDRRSRVMIEPPPILSRGAPDFSSHHQSARIRSISLK
jgi:hypothetical protein